MSDEPAINDPLLLAEMARRLAGRLRLGNVSDALIGLAASLLEASADALSVEAERVASLRYRRVCLDCEHPKSNHTGDDGACLAWVGTPGDGRACNCKGFAP